MGQRPSSYDASDALDECTSLSTDSQISAHDTQTNANIDDKSTCIQLQNESESMIDLLHIRQRVDEIDARTGEEIVEQFGDDEEQISREISLLEHKIHDLKCVEVEQVKLEHDELRPNSIELLHIAEHITKLKQGYEEQLKQKRKEKYFRSNLADVHDRLASVDALIVNVEIQLQTNKNADLCAFEGYKRQIDDAVDRLVNNVRVRIDELDRDSNNANAALLLIVQNRADASFTNAKRLADIIDRLLLLLKEWSDEKETIKMVIDEIVIDAILEKYNNDVRQSFVNGKQDSMTLSHILDRMEKLSTAKLIDLCKELKPTVDWPTLETDKLMERFKSNFDALRDLESRLRNDVEFEDKLIDEYCSIISQLNELADRVVTVTNVSTEESLAQMNVGQDDLKQIEKRIDTMKMNSIRMSSLIIRADASHLSTLETQYANVSTLVNSRAHELVMSITIAKEETVIREIIDAASNTINDVDATIEQLSSNVDSFKTRIPLHLNAITAAYKQIPINETTNDWRLKIENDCNQLNESVNSLKQLLQIRLQSRIEFDAKVANVVDRMNTIEGSLCNIEIIIDPTKRLESLHVNVQQMEQISKNAEQLMNDNEYRSSTMKSRVDQINSAVRDLRQRLQEKIDANQNVIQFHKRIDEIINDVNILDSTLNKIDSICSNRMINADQLGEHLLSTIPNAICDSSILNERVNELVEKVPPTMLQMKQLNNLKRHIESFAARISTLNQTLSATIKNANEYEQLRNGLDHNIRVVIASHVNGFIEKFTNANTIADASAAVERIQSLLSRIDEETVQLNIAQDIANRLNCRYEPLDDLKSSIEQFKSQLEVLRGGIVADIDVVTEYANEHERLLLLIDEIDRQLNELIDMDVRNFEEIEKKREKLETLRTSITDGEFSLRFERLHVSLTRHTIAYVHRPSIDFDELLEHYQQLVKRTDEAELEFHSRCRMFAIEHAIAVRSISSQLPNGAERIDELSFSIKDASEKITILQLSNDKKDTNVNDIKNENMKHEKKSENFAESKSDLNKMETSEKISLFIDVESEKVIVPRKTTTHLPNNTDTADISGFSTNIKRASKMKSKKTKRTSRNSMTSTNSYELSTALKPILSVDIDMEYLLGKGTYGVVMKATWKKKKWKGLRRKSIDVAAKIIHTENDEIVKREIAMMHRLKHTNIVELHGYGKMPNGDYFIVMEFMDGGSLDAILHKSEMKITFNILEDWLKQIADGLAFIHENGSIHRDLKPLNILLSNNMKIPKIGDFGTVRNELVPMTRGIGTIIYMAPEVIDNPDYTSKCDVYSFGIMLCEMYTRKRPYEGVPTVGLKAKIRNGLRPALSPEIDEEMQTMIKRCWEKDSPQRPTMNQIKDFSNKRTPEWRLSKMSADELRKFAENDVNSEKEIVIAITKLAIMYGNKICGDDLRFFARTITKSNNQMNDADIIRAYAKRLRLIESIVIDREKCSDGDWLCCFVSVLYISYHRYSIKFNKAIRNESQQEIRQKICQLIADKMDLILTSSIWKNSDCSKSDRVSILQYFAALFGAYKLANGNHHLKLLKSRCEEMIQIDPNNYRLEEIADRIKQIK